MLNVYVFETESLLLSLALIVYDFALAFNVLVFFMLAVPQPINISLLFASLTKLRLPPLPAVLSITVELNSVPPAFNSGKNVKTTSSI